MMHTIDIGLLQRSSAYVLSYADGAGQAAPPPAPAGAATAAPCAIRHVYGSGAGFIAQCDGQAVSVARPATEALWPSAGGAGRTSEDAGSARQVLLKLIEPERRAAAGPPVLSCMLLVLPLLLFALYLGQVRGDGR